MCGIAGINFPDKKLINQMTQALSHRGPDDSGILVDKKISLGHRRLSILDTTKLGNQPMEFEGLFITFNGEIYNFKSLKKSLQKKGHKFKSNSDTEMILHAYKEWGSKSVAKFDGIWALAIYDSKTQQLFLSRDRFGVKPLFYFDHAGEFLFASEIKAILKHDIFLAVNLNAMNWFFWQKYIPADESIYTQINQVPPGHNLTLNLKTNKFKITKYYDLAQEVFAKQSKDLDKRLDQVSDLLANAVNKQMLSDVPVGTFLSGGIDSGLISYFANNYSKGIHSFSMGFEQVSFDETESANRSANQIGTIHHQFKFKLTDQILEKILDHLDQPFADPALIPMYLLSLETKKQVTVALSGDGADEVFGGYDAYTGGLLADSLPSLLMQTLKPLGYLIPDSNKKVHWSLLIKRFLTRYQTNPISRHFNNLGTQTEYQRMQLLLQGYLKQFPANNLSNFDTLTQLQLTDFESFLPGDILYKTDLASMMTGLEVRVPYLDHELVETVLSLPAKYKNTIWKSKIMLRQIAQNHLGKDFANHKKRGFSIPLAQILNQSQLLQEYILSEKYYEHMWLDFVEVNLFWQQHQTGQIDNSRILWQVAIFNFWWWKHKEFIYV